MAAEFKRGVLGEQQKLALRRLDLASNISLTHAHTHIELFTQMTKLLCSAGRKMMASKRSRYKK